jgi:small nuclear ribonucleoprotein (snRNP)-like protein
MKGFRHHHHHRQHQPPERSFRDPTHRPPPRFPKRRTSSHTNQKKKKRVPKSFRTLIPLLNTYVGVQVTIELKNNTEIIGILDEVLYPSMNCILIRCRMKSTVYEFDPRDHQGDTDVWLGKSKSTKPIVQWARTKEIRVDRTFVHGSTIRYVHFPDHVNVEKQLASADKKVKSTKQLYDRGVRQDKKKQ